jgi:hypothetical protein
MAASARGMARCTSVASQPLSTHEPPNGRQAASSLHHLISKRHIKLAAPVTADIRLLARRPGMRSWTAVQPRDPEGRSPATGQRPWSAPSMITMDDPVVRALPGMGCALRPAHASPNTKTTTVCAGHRLGGAPRRNRTGDPILTMEPPGTAVRTAVSPARARPSRPKLSVLFWRSYALSSSHVLPSSVETPVEAPVHYPLDVAASQLEHRCHRQRRPSHHQAEISAEGVGQAVGLPCRSHQLTRGARAGQPARPGAPRRRGRTTASPSAVNSSVAAW